MAIKSHRDVFVMVIESRKTICQFYFEKFLQCVAFSPDNRFLALGKEHELDLIDILSKKSYYKFNINSNNIF